MKRQMYIPEIGNVIKLEKDWKFTLYCEYRNEKLFEAISKEKYNYREDGQDIEVTLPKGATLTIDRIYIRQGLSNYSSLSFYLDCPAISDKRLRFWAKLVDVNNIMFSIESKVTPVKLVSNCPNIRNGESLPPYDIRYFGDDGVYLVSETGTIELYKVDIKYDVEERQMTTQGWFGSSSYTLRIYENVKYYLLSLDNIELGVYKTRDSLMSAARRMYKEQNAAAITSNN